MAHDVFICYEKEDKPTADAVCAQHAALPGVIDGL